MKVYSLQFRNESDAILIRGACARLRSLGALQALSTEECRVLARATFIDVRPCDPYGRQADRQTFVEVTDANEALRAEVESLRRQLAERSAP